MLLDTIVTFSSLHFVMWLNFFNYKLKTSLLSFVHVILDYFSSLQEKI